ncbi:MAG: deoxyguanosinetriphosphate triphosphohydrolase [Candidatus Methylomirabilales bacterium]
MAGISTGSLREQREEAERAWLSPFAAKPWESRGREMGEEPHPYRSAFQRDRDRILHSKAFRRLGHKTQVFLAPEGDHYRVRLTHTLEVAQVARTIARALRLHEDLAEAVCLGHDLGHTPFGHLGEEVLTEYLGRPFRHNEQSLRIVERLEGGEGGRPGLNLTWEARDGILNHTWSMPPPSTLEAQVARLADRIAYVNHDIDDALRAGVLEPRDLPDRTRRTLGDTSSGRIDTMVSSVVEASLGAQRVGMGAEVLEVLLETRRFLFERVYLRPEVRSEHERARTLLRTICDHYRRHPEALPGPSGDDPEPRLIDYVAGMTDRFARREYERIVAGGGGADA